MDVHDWLSVALNHGQHFRQSMAPEKRRAQSFAHMCPVYDYKAWWFLITVVVLLMKWPFTSSPAAVLLNDGDDRWDASLERAQLSVSARFSHRLPHISHFASFLFVDQYIHSRCSLLTARVILWQSCRYCVSGFLKSRFHSKLQLCRRINAKHAFKSECHWWLSMYCFFSFSFDHLSC